MWVFIGIIEDARWIDILELSKYSILIEESVDDIDIRELAQTDLFGFLTILILEVNGWCLMDNFGSGGRYVSKPGAGPIFFSITDWLK